MLTSKRLYLEKLNSSDLEFYQEIYTSNELMEFVCPALDNNTATKRFNQVLSQMAQKQPKSILYVIRENNCNKKIGVIGLKWNQPKIDTIEIGIIISKAYQRQGLAHIAKKSLINYAFKHFKVTSIIANCDENNTAANLANQKLGFTKIKTFINNKNNKLAIRWKLTKEDNKCNKKVV